MGTCIHHLPVFSLFQIARGARRLQSPHCFGRQPYDCEGENALQRTYGAFSFATKEYGFLESCIPFTSLELGLQDGVRPSGLPRPAGLDGRRTSWMSCSEAIANSPFGPPAIGVDKRRPFRPIGNDTGIAPRRSGVADDRWHIARSRAVIERRPLDGRTGARSVDSGLLRPRQSSIPRPRR